MEPSIAAQRSTVRQQAGTKTAAGDESFYTIPWAEPLPLAPGADCDPVAKSELDALVKTNAAATGLKPGLLSAVVEQESGGRACAISDKGALGLMQLMPGTASRMGAADPFDPGQSMAAGARLLKELMDKYHGDVKLALSAYNAGESRVDAAGGIPEIAETQQYVSAISEKLKTGSKPVESIIPVKAPAVPADK